jgi:hypothetical protein
MIEKYYYQTAGDGCIERCNFQNDGTKIGSKKCAGCWECRAIDHEENWIKCQRIKEATQPQKIDMP